eukprot:gene34486-41753_t
MIPLFSRCRGSLTPHLRCSTSSKMKAFHLVDAGREFIRPNDFNVMIGDITEDDLKAIFGHFGCEWLQGTTKSPLVPLKGRVFGRNYRIFFPMVVQHKEKKVHVPMLFVTGSPFTFLRRETLAALGICNLIPLGAEVKIHGHAHQIVYESKGHFSNVDILGQDFIVANDMEVRVAGKRLRAVLDYAQDAGDDDDGVL